VQKRKKTDIVIDLRAKGYSTFKNDVQGAEEEQSESVTDYDYLLSMPIYSLTMERVELLNAEKEAKESELNALLKKSAKDLWRDDLLAFEEKWNEDANSVTVIDERPPSAKRPSIKTAALTKKTTTAAVKPAATKKLKASSSQEPIVSKASEPAAKKQATMEMFSKPISTVASVDDEDLPLAERINRMLAARMAASKPAAPVPVPVAVTKPSKPAAVTVTASKSATAKPAPKAEVELPARVANPPRARAATQKRTLTVSSDEEDEEEEEYTDEAESDEEYSE